MGRDGPAGDLLLTRRIMFQSTRPHGARPSVGPRSPSHAPIPFQSTRPHGARHRRRYPLLEVTPMFQSTRPHGARLSPDFTGPANTLVSIHAPAWGATLGKERRSPRRAGFNPRARMGRDCDHQPWSVCTTVSIHAPAWGATPAKSLARGMVGFNPRARMGRDLD